MSKLFLNRNSFSDYGKNSFLSLASVVMKRFWKYEIITKENTMLRTRIRIPAPKPRGEKRIQVISYSLSKSWIVYSSSPDWVTIACLLWAVSSLMGMCSLVQLCLGSRGCSPEAQQVLHFGCEVCALPAQLQWACSSTRLCPSCCLLHSGSWERDKFLSGLVDIVNRRLHLSPKPCIQFGSLGLFPMF